MNQTCKKRVDSREISIYNAICDVRRKPEKLRDTRLFSERVGDPGPLFGHHYRTVLLFHRASHTFHHYDSLRSGRRNLKAAQKLADCFLSAFVPEIQGKAMVTPVALQPQINGHDCGLYVCCLADMLSNWVVGDSQTQQTEGSEGEQHQQCAEEATSPTPDTNLELKDLLLLNEAMIAKLMPAFVRGERLRMLQLITRLASDQ